MPSSPGCYTLMRTKSWKGMVSHQAWTPRSRRDGRRRPPGSGRGRRRARRPVRRCGGNGAAGVGRPGSAQARRSRPRHLHPAPAAAAPQPPLPHPLHSAQTRAHIIYRWPRFVYGSITSRDIAMERHSFAYGNVLAELCRSNLRLRVCTHGCCSKAS